MPPARADGTGPHRCTALRQLGRADPAWEYANLAIRSKLLAEVVHEQLDHAIALEPTHVSFYAGGNDIISLRPRMNAVMERYEAAVRHLAESGAQVILFTTFDVTTSALLEPIRRRIILFNSGVREIAPSYNALLIDHPTLAEFNDRRLWSSDRIHMSRAGHKTLAGHVLRQLGVPHTLKLPKLPAFEPAGWRGRLKEDRDWVREEVIPLVGRRLTGVREGDALSPKWPVPIHPADGMKRLARGQVRARHTL